MWGGCDTYKYIFKDSIYCDYAEEPDDNTFTRTQWQAERDQFGLNNTEENCATNANKTGKQCKSMEFNNQTVYGDSEWNGEGLPPVGTVCEYYNNKHIQRNPEDCNLDDHCIIDTWSNTDEVKVICHATIYGKIYPVVQNLKTQNVSTIARTLLRPIPTPEQKAVEEMCRVFHSNCMHDYSGKPFLDGMTAVYRMMKEKQ